MSKYNKFPAVLSLLLVVGLACEKPKTDEPTAQRPTSSASTSSTVPVTTPKASAVVLSPAPDSIRPLHRRTYAIAVDKEIAYAGTSAGVVGWDYSNPKKPEVISSVVLRDSVQHLTKIPDKNLLAVATGPTGIALVDIDSPRDKGMKLLSEHPWEHEAKGGCHAAWSVLPTSSEQAFVACGGGGIGRVNLADPTRPRVDARAKVDGYVRDISLLGPSTILAAAGVGGLVVADFKGASPSILSKLDVGGEARGVEVHDGHAFVAAGAAGLVIVDIRSVQSPAVVARLLPETTDMARGIAIADQKALLCLGDSGLAIIDISNVKEPKEVGRFDPKGALNRVTLDGQRVFLANDAEGITLLDISNPAKPLLLDAEP